MHPDVSVDARSGERGESFPASDAETVTSVLEAAAACAPALAAAPPASRRDWLYAVADAVTAPEVTASLVETADRETGLGVERLTGEVARMAGQLRFYGDVAVEGSWLGASIDRAGPGTPALARLRVPLGPVAVFGASNFPFGFGTLGNDTGSALAAGCPVVVKAHPAHPATAALLGRVAARTLTEAGAPEDAFAQVVGFDAGSALVISPHVHAVAFTGSQRGGMALWQLANQRERVIPVFAEMGTVNPVVVTAAGARERGAEIAAGFVGSFTLGTGQFCTKPGLLLVPARAGLEDAVAAALREAAPRGWMLTEQIGVSAVQGISRLQDAGARVLAQVSAHDSGWASPATLLAVTPDQLTAGSRLLEECFGPVALVCPYADGAQLERVLDALQGTLAAAVMPGGPDDPEVPDLVARLTPLAGRVMVGDWPTGVAFTWAQQHGGPWPATSVPSATSVGAAALDRFTRPVTYQSTPDAALPPAVQEANPWRVPRRVDGVLEAAR